MGLLSAVNTEGFRWSADRHLPRLDDLRHTTERVSAEAGSPTIPPELLEAIAVQESDVDPTAEGRVVDPDGIGRGLGLMQVMSGHLGKQFPLPGLDRPQEFREDNWTDPLVNLRCAASILRNPPGAFSDPGTDLETVLNRYHGDLQDTHQAYEREVRDRYLHLLSLKLRGLR